MSADRPPLRVVLFGAPRVEQGGEPIPFGRQKGLALLSLLCIEPYPHSRDKILALLWPLFSPDDGRNNLRRELSLLRSLLGPDRLLADRSTIGLDPAALNDGLEVDVHLFDAWIAEVRDHGEAEQLHCTVCAQKLANAAAVYRDHLLVGFSLPDSPAFDEWQFFQAEHYRGAAASVFRRLAGWHERRQEFDVGLDYARRWLAIDPLHEPAHRALMTLYSADGQHSAALRQYDTLTRLLREELDVTPEPETTALHEAIRHRRASLPVVAVPSRLAADKSVTHGSDSATHIVAHNLPADTTPFIGREKELAQLDELLGDPAARLITILGVGGMGKTRLALALSSRQLGRTHRGNAPYADGIFMVALAPVEHPSRLGDAIARAVDFAFHGEHDRDRQIIDFLRNRKLLLILDNFEHLIDATSVGLLLNILAEAPGVCAIVTSRIRLNARGEHLFRLNGLEIPDEEALGPAACLAVADGTDAPALFCQSARRARADFVLDENTLPTVLRICRLVQGMPLGIELAAGWLGLLGVEEIATEIEKSLDFLEADWHDLPDRQSSLRAVFDTSWKLLTSQEQTALMSLTVFRGGFTREAAEAVAGASLRMLLSLAAKSWLQAAEGERYQIHELLRQYAARELISVPEGAGAVRQRHAFYFAGYLRGLEPRMRGSQPSLAYAAVDEDFDNVQSAFEWLIDRDELDVAVGQLLPGLFRYLESRYRYFLLQPLIARAEKRARALGNNHHAGVLLIVQSAFFFNGYPTRYMDYHWISAVSTEIMQRAWAIMPAEPVDTGFWSTLLGWQYGRFVNFEAAVGRLGQLVKRFQKDGRTWETAFAMQCLGRLLTPRPWDTTRHGPTGEAGVVLQQALQLFNQLGDEREEAVTLLFLGFERQAAGDMADARRLAGEAQYRLRAIGDDIIAVTINWSLAEIHLQLGEVQESLRMFHELAEAFINAGRPHLAIDGLSRASYETVRYGDLDEALRLRERCLTLSRASGHLGYESWDSWEMGEVYRVRGDLEQARRWFERSLALFRATASAYEESEVGQSFYHRGLGDLALAEGNAVEAAAYFAEAARFAQATHHTWQYAYATTGLGRAALMAGDSATAARHLSDGLRVGASTGDAGIVLVSFAGAAQFFMVQGDPEHARHLAGRILAHPLAWNETRREVARLLEMDREEADRLRDTILFDLTEEVAELVSQLEAQT